MDAEIKANGDDVNERPWEELGQLVETGAEAQVVDAYLDTLSSGEAARAVCRLSDDDQSRLLTTLAPADAADLIEDLPEAQAADMLAHIAPASAAAILHELPSDGQADLLGDLSSASAEAILSELEPAEAEAAMRLAAYPSDVAGGLMLTEYLAYAPESTVRDVIVDLRDHAERYTDYSVQYAYIVDRQRRLVGVLPLRQLLLSKREQQVGDLMITQPLSVSDRATLEDLEGFFTRHHFLAAPVIDDRGRLMGVVRRFAVEEALRERNENQYRRSRGLVREELRSMPLLTRSRRRLSWLSVNILLNVAAASVIAMYQSTLESVIALAVFLPIISDMSGCSGNQAVAVSMRELALGLVKPADVLYVLAKEVVLGLVNGCSLGMLIAAVAILWKGNPYLGLVVGSALALNTAIAVCIGGTIPLILKRFGKDPALASGPILTTITDMCGFLIVLSFASALLPYLQS